MFGRATIRLGIGPHSSFIDFLAVFGSRPSDHYFRSVCPSVCLFVCAEFFSAVFDPISINDVIISDADLYLLVWTTISACALLSCSL